MRNNINLVVLPILSLLIPLLFLPLFLNAFGTTKAILLVLGILALIVSKVAGVLTTHKLHFPQARVLFPLLAIIAVTLATLIFNPEARTEALLDKAFLLLALPILSLLVLSHETSPRLTKLTIFATLVGTTILGLFSIIHLTFLYNQASMPLFMQSRLFTPTGSVFATIALLSVGLVMSVAHAISQSSRRYLMFFFAAVHFVGLAAYLSLMLRTNSFSGLNLPFLASWSIMLDAAKSLRALLIGIGLANFPALYTSVKPAYLNATPFWNLTPNNGGSELLQLMATGGILVIAAFISFFATAIAAKNTENKELLPLRYGFFTLLLAFFFMPGSITTYAIFFILGTLLLSESHTPSEYTLALPQLRYGYTIIMVGFVGVVGFFLGKAYLADFYLYQAQAGLQANDGKTVYEKSLAAVSLMPNLAGYRVSYSQVNLSLASTLSQSGKEATDATKTQIATLLSQAVREAKAATTLRPNLSSTWQNLSQIYGNLIGVSDGADQLAVDNLKTAIDLDTANPMLRVEYGGLLSRLAGEAKDKEVAQNLYTQALQEFQTAARLKNDYANAYYNLGKTSETLGNIEIAISALNQVLSILDPSSADYQKAKAELDTLKASQPSPTPTASGKPVTQTPAATPAPTPMPTPAPTETTLVTPPPSVVPEATPSL